MHQKKGKKKRKKRCSYTNTNPIENQRWLYLLLLIRPLIFV